MTQIAVEQNKIAHFQLTTTSKYISRYIQQRKTLMLSKLAQTTHQLCNSADQPYENGKMQQVEKTQKAAPKHGSNMEESRKTSHLFALEKSNKINKKDNFPQFKDPNKFIARSNLYQKQKQLKQQFQKRKHFYKLNSEQKNLLTTPKKEEHNQLRTIEKKLLKQQQTYHQMHERKHSKNTGGQRKIYKDLIKQSMNKYTHNQLKPNPIMDERLRWRQIQQIFEKIKAYHPNHDHPMKVDENHENHQTRDDYEKDHVEENAYQLGLAEVKLTLKKVESEQKNLSQFMQNLEMQQHFQEELSGILMDEDLKQEIDSSHVFQRVVNEMMFESETVQLENAVNPPQAEIIRSISILALDAAKEQQDMGGKYHQFNQINQDEWIKNQPFETSNHQNIQIKKVQSEIIENNQEISNNSSASIIVASKIEQINDRPEDVIKVDKQADKSLIDQLSEELLKQQSAIIINIQKQQPQNDEKQPQLQKQSLEVLANQFLLMHTAIKPSEQEDEDIDIPDEQCRQIMVVNFDFNSVNHQTVASIIAITTPKTEDHQQPQILINGQHECEETTMESEENSQWHHEEEVRVNNTLIRTLRSFGDFLVIPEESQEESRQSVG